MRKGDLDQKGFEMFLFKIFEDKSPFEEGAY